LKILVFWIIVFKFLISYNFTSKGLTKETMYFWISIVSIIPRNFRELNRLLIWVKRMILPNLRMHLNQMCRNAFKMLNSKLLKVTKMDFWSNKDKIYSNHRDNSLHWWTVMIKLAQTLVHLKIWCNSISFKILIFNLNRKKHSTD
jgi:hypothetical protein